MSTSNESAAPLPAVEPAAAVVEPVARTSERHFALREAHLISVEEAYFDARPVVDTPSTRRYFRAGFERGFDAAEKAYPAHPTPAEPAQADGGD